MPRHQYKRKKTVNDPVYNSLEVAKLINYIMVDGKKNTARAIVYNILEKLKKEEQDPLKILHKAIANVSPALEVKPRRLGGASYLVPAEVRKERKLYLALNWMIEAAQTKSNKEFHQFEDKLLTEILDAAKGQGQAMNKKLQVEKTADANKAFAHLKW